MKRSLLSLSLLVSMTCAPLAQASPGCDQCEDLPRLYRELLEQEFLRAKFQSWVDMSYYPGNISALQTAARNALNTAMHGGLYGPVAPPGGAAGIGTAAPSFGTQVTDAQCGLVEYVRVKPTDTEDTAVPITPAKLRQKLCKPLADFTLAHEGLHEASCKAAWKAGEQKKMSSVEWFAKDDLAAYQAGIKALREHIAALAKQCNWSGSTNDVKPDKTKTVPTPDQIANLARATRARASALGRASR